jgi:hypothetical protein
MRLISWIQHRGSKTFTVQEIVPELPIDCPAELYFGVGSHLTHLEEVGPDEIRTAREAVPPMFVWSIPTGTSTLSPSTTATPLPPVLGANSFRILRHIP